MFPIFFISVCLAIIPVILAHGNIDALTLDGKKYVTSRSGDTAGIARAVGSNSPVKDVTSNAIACNIHNGQPSPASKLHGDVHAGSTITYQWNNWTAYIYTFTHLGPITTYMADCNGDCTSFDPVGKPVWFKIAEQGADGDYTGSDGKTMPYFATVKFANEGSVWPVVIPKDLKPGKYLLRHEVMALHLANRELGAEFYPGCQQVNVISTGNKVPASPLVAFPGAYKQKDPGILFNLYQASGALRTITEGYTIPGPPLATFKDGPPVQVQSTDLPSTPLKSSVVDTKLSSQVMSVVSAPSKALESSPLPMTPDSKSSQIDATPSKVIQADPLGVTSLNSSSGQSHSTSIPSVTSLNSDKLSSPTGVKSKCKHKRRVKN